MSPNEEISAVFTGNLEEAYREYLITGGLPEVVFIIQKGVDAIPIEVISARRTRSKSLTEYRKKYTPRVAVLTSLKNYARHMDEHREILEIPLYLIWRLKAYL